MSSYAVYQPFSDTKTDEKPQPSEAGPITRMKTRQRARWDSSTFERPWRSEAPSSPAEGHFVATLLSQAWMSAAESQKSRREAGLTSGSETDENSKGSPEKASDEGPVSADDSSPLAQTLLALIGRRNGQHAAEGGVGPPDGPTEWTVAASQGALGTCLSSTASNVQDIVTSLATATQQVVQQQRLLISQFDDTLANFLSATFSDTTSPNNVSLVMEQQERILQQQVLALEIATHRFSMFRKQLASVSTKKRARESADGVKLEDEPLGMKPPAPIVSAVASSSPPTTTNSCGPTSTSYNPPEDCRISRSLPPAGSYWPGDGSTGQGVYGLSDPEVSNNIDAGQPGEASGLVDLKTSFMFNSEDQQNPNGAWNDVMGFKRKKSKGEKIHLANTTHYCSMCQSNMTPQWRYLSTQRFCNACYMRLKRSMASKGVTMQSLKRFAAASNHIIGAVSDVQREAASLTQAMLAPPLAETSIVHTVMSTPVEDSRMADQPPIPQEVSEGNNKTHKAPSMYPSNLPSFCLEPGSPNFLGGFTT